MSKGKQIESVAISSPEMRERGVKRLLAAIDLAIAEKRLSPRSIIADARLDLGGIMDADEAEKVLWPMTLGKDR